MSGYWYGAKLSTDWQIFRFCFLNSMIQDGRRYNRLVGRHAYAWVCVQVWVEDHCHICIVTHATAVVSVTLGDAIQRIAHPRELQTDVGLHTLWQTLYTWLTLRVVHTVDWRVSIKIVARTLTKRMTNDLLCLYIGCKHVLINTYDVCNLLYAWGSSQNWHSGFCRLATDG